MRKNVIWFGLALALLSLALPLAALEFSAYTDAREILVSGEQEFVEAIAPNTTIRLAPITTDYLTFTGEFAGLNPDHVSFEEVFDGLQIVIHDVQNLSIFGDAEQMSQILALPRYANVLTFRNCDGLSLANLDCGHYEEGYCTGGVLGFEDCSGVTIFNCNLWGCGIEGISLMNTTGLDCSFTTIRDCSYSILSLFNSRNISFSYCVMRNNREFDLLNFSNCARVEFHNCVIYDNSSANDWGSGNLINSSGSEILFSECAIFNNNVDELLNASDGVYFEHCSIFNNKNWGYRPFYDEGRAEDGDPGEEYYYEEW
ncbi:MAG: right-handed parallel beta-helix repeat-containing protein [Candidatus Cloacimonetes bacterium]|jgi:hypothetical protein|nr:right-handed parallel beta-helix repeat-containing protein [Candidatus Cloacimonadota bacterium]MDD4224478.1 right-handed parallel beta-helix repeat-containing protein [Candidatus Cloacimonadota bacterium]